MQVNSINNNQLAFGTRNVVLNPAILNEGEKVIVKPLLAMSDSYSMIEEDVLRAFMQNFPDATKICLKMINSAKSPVQDAFNKSMNIVI